MPAEEKITPDTPSPPENPATRREFIGIGMKGIALLPYVAPLIETYLIGSASADSRRDDVDDDDDDRDTRKISRPPQKEKSKMKHTRADDL